LADESLELWHARPDALRIFLVQSACTGLERGEHEQLLPEIERAVAGNTSSIGYAWRAALACGLASIGRVEEATARLDELSADKFRALTDDHHRPLALRWLSEAVARLDLPETAEHLLPIVEPYSGLMLVGSGITSIEGAADRAIGQLLATLGRTEDAVAAYDRADDLETRLGFEALALRTRAWQSAVLGSTELACATAERAAALGMTQLTRESVLP
jgi:hypothetical protein